MLNDSVVLAARQSAAMTRKGEVSRADIMRKWPQHVALVRGIVNDEMVRGSADTLSVAPRPYHLRRDDFDFVVFCFAESEDADAFCQQFEEERLHASLVRER